MPSLINLSGRSFDETLPLRGQAPVVNTVPGVGQAGDVEPYGAYLRRAALAAVESKSVIVQFAAGDRSLPNLTTTAILRAGELADRAIFYRFDLFLASSPTTPPPVNDPHSLIFPFPPSFSPPPEGRAAGNAVALGAQEQIAVFFASEGAEVIDPDGPGALFEAPIAPPLPEDVQFCP